LLVSYLLVVPTDGRAVLSEILPVVCVATVPEDCWFAIKDAVVVVVDESCCILRRTIGIIIAAHAARAATIDTNTHIIHLDLFLL
jgi:hypothetical protein